MHSGKVVAVIALLCGCSNLESGPSEEDLLPALRRHFNQFAILQAKPTGQCEPGSIGDREVAVCSYCVVWVGYEAAPYTGAVRRVSAIKDKFKAAFTRAVSLDQPAVQPRGNSGVWIVATSPTSDSEASQSRVSVDLSEVPMPGLEISKYKDNFGWGPDRLQLTSFGQNLSPNAAMAHLETPEAAEAVLKSISNCS